MEVPVQWREFPCEDYFHEGWCQRGYFDEPSQTWVITPLAEAYEDAASEFFAVGRSGRDGIDFGYRKGHPGLWALYPIDRAFKFMASTIAELVDGWCAGRLLVYAEPGAALDQLLHRSGGAEGTEVPVHRFPPAAERTSSAAEACCGQCVCASG